MAKETDPNSPLGPAATAVLADTVFKGLRDLEPNETIRSEPEPLVHFDWSVDEAKQEDIEHVFYALQQEGYYTHPLPDIKHWQDRYTWHKQMAGVWRHEPDWYIVEFDDSGRKTIKEKVDLPLSSEWEINTGSRDNHV